MPELPIRKKLSFKCPFIHCRSHCLTRSLLGTGLAQTQVTERGSHHSSAGSPQLHTQLPRKRPFSIHPVSAPQQRRAPHSSPDPRPHTERARFPRSPDFCKEHKFVSHDPAQSQRNVAQRENTASTRGSHPGGGGVATMPHSPVSSSPTQCG